jgi:hypothetical protein
MARIVVCGYMVRHPVAGNMLAYFQYILGLYRLGHKICYLEESGWSESCYNPVLRVYGDDPGIGLSYVKKMMNIYGMTVPVFYVHRDSRNVLGGTWDDVRRTLGSADLLLNVGGVCWLPEFCLCGRRVFIDMDPLFTQLGYFGAECLHEHHVHFSYGVNIGKTNCTIPSGGIDWLPTLPPVVPEIWETTRPAAKMEEAQFTTIANWSAYGSVTYGEDRYGQKDEEFLRLLHLPRYTSQKLELSLSGAGDDIIKKFRNAGWFVRDAGLVSRDMATYQDYIHTSRGELTVAKHAYVKTRSGWFSDRSVCYLAAGRPVILQDTGFSDYISTGLGVLAFSFLDEAVECINKVNAEYAIHSRAARIIAEEKFSYKTVLPGILKTLKNN